MNVRIRKRVFRQLLGMVTILGGMFLLSLPAQAITYWQVGTGDWSTGANWDNGEPTSDDYAYINNGGTAQITLNDRVCRSLNLGRNAGESGTVEMSSGSLSARKYETIGYEGTGTFTQSGGTNTIKNSLSLGISSMGNGTYNLNAGILSAKNEYLGGSSGTGTFTQTGGTNTVANDLYLSHGSLSGGSGIYTQSGGTNTVGNKLYLGSFTSDSSGSYNLSGGSLSSGYETIGLVGTATFTQSGGINAVSGSLYVGSSSAGGGTYNLSFGSLSTNYEAIGLYSRTGVFTQSGGTHTVTSKLYIGYSSPSSSGTYSISSGSLNVRSFYIGYHSRGTLHITDPAANITVSNLLSFGTDSTFTAVPGATIHMTGSALENISPDPDNLAGLSNLELVFEGGSTDIDPFEVAGQDLGAVMAGFDSNFALGTLTLGGTDIGQVQLVDSFANQTGWEGSEALYVYNLNLGTGSYLDLNGLNLYYLNGLIDPAATILGGQLTPIPEPSTLILLGAGLVGLVGLRKRS